MSEWQPIETAPKDGAQILLTNGSAVCQGWWQRYETEMFLGDEWMTFDGGMLPEPTHWMPLPAPPEV